MSKPLTAMQITDLLINTRHKDDLCVPECKDGASQGKSHRRLDLWVMKRSYANFRMFGYEIKVSRSDFSQDKKWPDYLPLCNEFYFVTPWGMVEPTEVPEPAGLIWCSSNLTRCCVKKKAGYRRVDLPHNLLIYILMSRVTIQGEALRGTNENKLAHLREWVQHKRTLKELGYSVACRLAAETSAIERRNKELEAENEALKTVRAFWTETLGCKVTELKSTYYRRLEDTLAVSKDRMREAGLREVMQALSETTHDLESTEKRIAMLRSQIAATKEKLKP